MAFTMNFSSEQLSGASPVPAGPYTLEFSGFDQKASKVKPGETESSSINLNPILKIIGNAEYEGRRIFANLNTKGPWVILDFVHACGIPMEEIQDEFAGTEKANYTIPGVFEGSDDSSKTPEQWKYQGPLLNKTLQVEVAHVPASGGYKEKNDVRQYICAVPNCTVKHSTNLIKN
jgi:hypothetical protein